jgi:Raf kinase inhibitor-like YbhB/YbcL family protein
MGTLLAQRHAALATTSNRVYLRPSEPEGSMLTITSTAFTHGGSIPGEYTCDASDTAPELQWSGAPSGTKSFALIVDDPDAPDPKAPKMTYVHWVLYDIAPNTTGIPKGGRTPAGARDGKNDWKRTGYGGPCPPIGRHRYFFKLFALDAMLGDLGTPTKADLLRAMEEHVLAQAELMGTYERSK